MTTDMKQREPTDRTRINVLNVKPEALRAAVEEHDPSAEEIRRKLHEARKIAFSKGGED